MFSGLRRQDCCWKVRLSYVEIYNETFRDLLNPDTPAADLSITEKKCGPCESHKASPSIVDKGQGTLQECGDVEEPDLYGLQDLGQCPGGTYQGQPSAGLRKPMSYSDACQQKRLKHAGPGRSAHCEPQSERALLAVTHPPDALDRDC